LDFPPVAAGRGQCRSTGWGQVNANQPVQGTFVPIPRLWGNRGPDPGIRRADMEATMNSVIYLVGLIVVVLFILSYFGLG